MESTIKDLQDLQGIVGAEHLLETVRSQCVPFVDEAVRKLDDLLMPRRFRAAFPPPPERVIYRIGEATVATPGNLMGVYAQPKAGKTAFMGAVMASAMETAGDTFDVSSANPEGWAILHLDTEQSPFHHYKAVSRALERAERAEEPEWLYSYRMTDVSLVERRDALRHEMRRRHADHHGIHSVLLDGVADFIMDPNDPAEAFAWVEELHQLAIRYDTIILCVLHENPGSEIGKTRGHLGSQLERKAETNLRLMKDTDGVTVVFTERSRQAHIPRDRGPRFKWDNEAMRHVSCEVEVRNKQTEKALELVMFANQVFSDVPADVGLGWAEVIERVQRIDELSMSGARKRLAALVAKKAVRHAGNRYFRNA